MNLPDHVKLEAENAELRAMNANLLTFLKTHFENLSDVAIDGNRKLEGYLRNYLANHAPSYEPPAVDGDDTEEDPPEGSAAEYFKAID